MSETCAACRKGKGPMVCEVCGFSDGGVISREFPTSEDLSHWLETVVKPYRMRWEIVARRKAELLAQIQEMMRKSEQGLVKLLQDHILNLQAKHQMQFEELKAQIDELRKNAAKPHAQAEAASAQRVSRIPSDFVRIEGGMFQMGTHSGGKDNERPVRNITISGFYMCKFPVTQKEWYDVMGTNPSRFKGDNHPVEQVSWHDAVEYANQKSLLDGLAPAYKINGMDVKWDRSVNGYRLPTEAEWEYAARGGNGSPGNFEYSGSDNVDEVAWYEKDSGVTTHPVGKKKSNGLGLYDMSGNVWEWCWDLYGGYPNKAEADSVGASSESKRVNRGGSWGSSAGGVCSAYRSGRNPTDRNGSFGFRLVRPLV